MVMSIIISAMQDHTKSVDLSYNLSNCSLNFKILPGSHPRRVSKQFNSTAQVQHPVSIQTAIGGKKIAQNILQTSLQVTVILVICLFGQGHAQKFMFTVL
jgi:hypothetical protein